tara:strand:- start:752 stop:1528 length:777 start_codon:yes stop_codon:yes gene_type:complete
MKIIIVAAGEGVRLRPLTNDRPKCMLEINGKPILEYQLEVIKKCGIKDITLVKGYKGDFIQYKGIKYYTNDEFYKNNMLKSLFYAKEEINDDFIFSFADIIYTHDLFEKVVSNKDDFCIVTDIDWKKNYEDRDMHPVEQANLVKVENGLVVKIGRDNIIKEKDIYGEFIGIAKFSRKGALILKKRYAELEEKFNNSRPQKFHNAKLFEKSYFDDMIQELINLGHPVKPIPITSGWVEIDTIQDLTKAEERIKENGNIL